MEIVGLPGTYSLTANAVDEPVARNFIVEEKPDVVVDIVDTTNLERNLYLTLLLIEAEANTIVALNMWDVARGRGVKIDTEKLEELLGAPVILTVATTGEGIEDLKDRILYEIKNKERRRKIEWGYGDNIEKIIRELQGIIKKDEALDKYPSRWLAIKIIEHDKEILKKVEESPYKKEIFNMASNIKNERKLS